MTLRIRLLIWRLVSARLGRFAWALALALMVAVPGPSAAIASATNEWQSASAPKAAPDQEIARLSAAVRSRLEEMRAEADFPGMTASFVLPDGRTGSVGIGQSDVEAGVAMTGTERMLAGSIGKTWFAAVALQLVEEGRFDLDAPVERWLGKEPWFARLPNAKALTVRMLMNHTSGIPEHVENPKFLEDIRANPDRIWKPEDLLAYILDREPHFPAGKGWSYADTNYIVMGMVVERVLNRPFYDEVEQRILKPLKLADTIPSTSRTLPGLIPGYPDPNSPFKLAGRTVVDGRFVVNPQMEWTGGGFVSTSRDLARWARALYGGDVLSARQKAAMLEAVPARTGRDHRYGLGVQVRPTPFGMTHGHSGWFPGYLSDMAWFPEHDLAVAVQFNTDSPARLKGMPQKYLVEVARVILAAREATAK